MPHPTASELIFSEQANHKFSKTLGEIRRATLSISNRLQSISSDAEFAESVADAYRRPLVTNERCGSWYVRPQNKTESAYFKSTDGHTGVWKFSSRRLNVHLLEIIGKNDGCIIVDSTRRGKSMPDALSKTVPIWCTVFNRVLFPEIPESHELYTPPQVVSRSEHAQIATLLPSFCASLKALGLSFDTLRSNITKPIRPIWLTPDSYISPTTTVFEDFHPIICCTVSRRVHGAEISGGGYIQGAGDDTENWARGLTPVIFWANQTTLASASEAELPDLIDALVSNSRKIATEGDKLRCVKQTSSLFIIPIVALTAQETGSDTYLINLLPLTTEKEAWGTAPTRLDIGLGTSKLGSRNLRVALPFIADFIEKIVLPRSDACLQQRIIIACDTGRDLSIGVALTLLCLFFDNDGKLLQSGKNLNVNKDFIRRRLSWLSTSMPDANPSRATLQSVNSFLMQRPA